MGKLKDFLELRDKQNQALSKYASHNMKQFLGIDFRTYQTGALDVKTKELLGLVASLVLRCDDCVSYHLSQLRKLKVTDEELEETMMIGLLVGGSIVIPHIRRAFVAWDSEKEQ